MTCIVMVEPPLTVCPLFTLSLSARPMARKSTPGCHKKRLSSNCTRALAKRSGTVSLGGKRHWPSSATRAPSNSPSALSATVLYTVPLNRSRGRHSSHAITSAAATPIIHHLLLVTFYFTLHMPSAVEAVTAGRYMSVQTVAGSTNCPQYAARRLSVKVLKRPAGRAKNQSARASRMSMWS